MKLLKKINNNFALALDSRGEQIIVEGRGIGFQKMPCELGDLSIVKRTYYDIKEQDIHLLQSVSEEVLELCSLIYEYALTRIEDTINPNLTLILADHVQFCIERYHKHISFQMPIYYDIEYLYPKESEIAEMALKLIEQRFHITLPESEKTGIALNIINSEMISEAFTETNSETIELCTGIIERKMKITIHKNSFSYSRFVTHLEYLFRRGKHIPLDVSLDNQKLYQAISEKFPQVEECVKEISRVLKTKGYYLNEEEKLYLMLHVNRLCHREDCYS